MNGFDLSTISNCYIGGTQASAIYIGSTKLWPTGHDYSQDYFTIESLEDNNLIKLTSSSTTKRYITYKTSPTSQGNPAESGTGNYGTTFITLNTGDKVYISSNSSWATVTSSDYTYFESTKTVNVYGNVNSVRDLNFKTNNTMPDQTYFYYRLFYKLKIVDASNLVLPYTTIRNYCYMRMFDDCTTLTAAPALPATTLADNCYQLMFSGCTSLTTAHELPATTLTNRCYYSMFKGCTSLTTAPSLPATTLTNYCYSNMFNGCSSLTTAPSLPATTLATYCYQQMFLRCTSLTTAPSLPATTLATYCYQNMFNGCSSLTTAPSLPATTLAQECYLQMFKGCTSLTSITCLATNISAANCVYNWLTNVSSTGTFTKNANMTSWPSGSSGIPSGWTVVDA